MHIILFSEFKIRLVPSFIFLILFYYTTNPLFLKKECKNEKLLLTKFLSELWQDKRLQKFNFKTNYKIWSLLKTSLQQKFLQRRDVATKAKFNLAESWTPKLIYVEGCVVYVVLKIIKSTDADFVIRFICFIIYQRQYQSVKHFNFICSLFWIFR